jgi:NitT/TauT family transport system ATP-binding protein/nitrate/nitrite transport system substrate-binding protein
LVDRVYRPDLYRGAALSLGPIVEPALAFADAAQTADARLFDGRPFEPTDARAYATGFQIGRVRT